jgi:hypothetical protein
MPNSWNPKAVSTDTPSCAAAPVPLSRRFVVSLEHVMRAEAENATLQIKQALDLLRRSL